MILHLTILNGTHAGHSVQVTAGTPRTFGRAAQADVVLQDVYLSDVHFALYCDEQGARVRDLQSHNGTFVNNAPVTDATLAAGDRISAGQTVFEVAITAHGLEAPASALSTTGEITAEDLVRGMQSAPHDCARWALHSEEGNYFAVIDCARGQVVGRPHLRGRWAAGWIAEPGSMPGSTCASSRSAIESASPPRTVKRVSSITVPS